MKNIVYQFLFVLLISGVLFTGCVFGGEEEVEENEVEEVAEQDGEEESEEDETDEEEEEENEEDEEESEEENAEKEVKDSQEQPPGLNITLPDASVELVKDPEEEVVEEEVEEELEEEVEDQPEELEEGLSRGGGGEEVEADESAYVDGSYTQVGNYQSPAGSESVAVTIVLADDVITSVSVVPNSERDVSLHHQEDFAAGVAAVVLGKSLDEIGNLGAVNGSSLTPKGFNSAISAIKSAAKS